jgi:hypothetical protein
MFLFQLSRYLLRKKSCLDIGALRILFEVHLTLCHRPAAPTKVFVAPRALNMSTGAVLHQLKVLSAVVGRTLSGTIFEKDSCEKLLSLFVAFDNVRNAFNLGKLLIMVDSVN